MYKKQKEFEWMCKFLIIGNSQVGKTNLMLRFCSDTYWESHMATIGVDFKFKEVTMENKVMKMQIWDTAGQERFRTLTHSYYKGAHGVLLVFGVDDLESFNEIGGWMQSVKQYGKDNVQIVLVGNKCDLEMRVVSTEMGRRMAEQYGLEYYETSAKEGTNVQQVFMRIAELVATNYNAQTPSAKSVESFTYQLDTPSNKKHKKQKCC